MTESSAPAAPSDTTVPPEASPRGIWRPRVRVKICGITTAEDAEAAIEAGADALGFNGFAGSKRFIDLAACASWIAQLPPFVMRVAVLVNPRAEEVEAALALPGIDAVQFHGDETPAFCEPFCRHGFIKAVAARDKAALEASRRFATKTLLLDAWVPGAYGGTGQLIDLPLAAGFVAANRDARVILSGGLTPENVARAVEAVRPWAVDVASGVEATPRKKDVAKMRAFVEAVRSVS